MAVSADLISSRSNQRIKQLRAAFAGNRRLSAGLVAIEGEHLLEEALRSGVVPATVFLTPQRKAPRNLPHETEILQVSEEVFASAVETQAPQGVAALIEPIAHDLESLQQKPSPLLLMAAEVQDPGNLGTLIRSAEAFGAAGVLTTDGTVSAWNQKALRASVGSVFRLPVVHVTPEEFDRFSHQRFHILAAVSADDAGVTSAPSADLTGPMILMIGNEGNGLSDTWLRRATAKITIPCPGPVESLNAAVAGSLLLYEAARQRSNATQQQSQPQPRIPNPQPRRPSGATR